MPTLKLLASQDALTHERAERLLLRLCEVMAEMETVDPKTIKACVLQTSASLNFNSTKRGFLCLEVCVLSGRPIELRTRMAEALKTVLELMMGGDGLSLTVEVREMNKDTYRS